MSNIREGSQRCRLCDGLAVGGEAHIVFTRAAIGYAKWIDLDLVLPLPHFIFEHLVGRHRLPVAKLVRRLDTKHR